MKKILLFALVGVVLAALIGAGSLVGLYMWASRDLPGFTSITDYRPPLVTTVYTRSGDVLGYFYSEKRFLVTLDEMTPMLPKAFLAAEDAAFYSHEGVDVGAIVRAALANVRAGHIRQGGSTITQQIIKRLLLTPERSYKRKLKEAILAYRLERYLTKDEILTIYLNQIYLGSGAYGVEAAARTFFGVTAKELTLAQAALIAGLPQAPSRYTPYRHPKAARARQEYVLEQMLAQNWITKAQYDEALAEELVFKSAADPSWQQGGYYLEEVRRLLVERYGEKEVYEGGLHVRTACEMDHQIAAENALKRGLEASTRRRGWHGPVRELSPEEYGPFLTENGVPVEALAEGEWVQVLVTDVATSGAQVRMGTIKGTMPVDTMHWAREPDISKATDHVPAIKDARKVIKPGDVVWASVEAGPTIGEEGKRSATWVFGLQQVPLVEGALVSMEPEQGDVVALVGGYSFGRSQFNRATQAKRQPGSAFKPIVYSTALDNGYTPASIILDAPIVFTDYSKDETWKPENFEETFTGPTLLRTALVKSKNICTIRMAQKLGINKIIERAKAMGLETDFPQNLSVALGSAEVTLIDLVSAYSGFARMGTVVEPRLIHSVTSAWGEEMYANEPVTFEAISPQTAYIMTGLLQEVVQDGTGWRAKKLGRAIGGKTGTTNEERDAWFMGFSPYLVSGVYVGFDDHREMGKWETGSRAASTIWVDYRQMIEENYPPQKFPQPPGISMVRVDGTSGKLASPASESSYFLPFKQGTEPTEVAVTGDTGLSVGAPVGEELFKQGF